MDIFFYKEFGNNVQEIFIRLFFIIYSNNKSQKSSEKRQLSRTQHNFELMRI